MDILEKIRQQVPPEQYRDLMEYIEELKDQAYSDGFDQGTYTESFNNSTY